MIQLLAALSLGFVLVQAQYEYMARQTLCMFEAQAKGIDIDTQEGWEKVEQCMYDTECFLVNEEEELWECRDREN